MEPLVKTGLLYDFYGGLLTAKQRKIMDLYYNEDWSLTEIAEKEAVSRQAVYDLVHRSERILEDYEAKLGLLDRFLRQQALINVINHDFNRLLRQIPPDSPEYGDWLKIKMSIDQLIALEIDS